jgi:hypothetical protein
VLAVPGHAAASEFLTTVFRQGLGQSEKLGELRRVLETMIRVGHPRATDAFIEVIKTSAQAESTYRYCAFYWVGRLIPRLPRAEALPKLEALLPTLPQPMIGPLLGYVAELKQATPTVATTG